MTIVSPSAEVVGRHIIVSVRLYFVERGRAHEERNNGRTKVDRWKFEIICGKIKTKKIGKKRKEKEDGDKIGERERESNSSHISMHKYS